MKANELRIGNWIFDAGDEQKPFQIEEIRKNGEGFKCYYIVFRNGSFKSSIDSDLIEPIELTPEILEKCGFVKHGVLYIHPSTMNFEMYNRAKLEGVYRWYAGRNQKDYFLGVSNEIKHMHQLQNIYFALTGEELTVNL